MDAFLNQNQRPTTIQEFGQILGKEDPHFYPNPHFEKILTKKCRYHPYNNAEFLNFTPNMPNPRVCKSCVQEQCIPHQNYLDISEVLYASSDTDLKTYPKLTDPYLRSRLKYHADCLENVHQYTEKYFKEFDQKIPNLMEQCKQAHKLNMINFSGLYRNSLDCWISIQNIEGLQSILFKEGDNEMELTEFINNHIIEAEPNTQKLTLLCQQFEIMKESFSPQQPNSIGNLICSLLQELNFFGGSQLTSLNTIQQSEQYISEVQRFQRAYDELQEKFNKVQIQIQEDHKSYQLLMEEQQQENSRLYQQIQDNQRTISSLEEFLEAERNSNQELNIHIISLMYPPKKELNGLVPFVDLIPSTRLILSTKGKKGFVYIEQNRQALKLISQNFTDSEEKNQAYLSFILNPKTNYVIQVKFWQVRKSNQLFLFGLIPDKKKDTTWGSQENLCYCEQNENCGVNNLIKGNPIPKAGDKSEERSYEIRINIQHQIFRIGLLPLYQSVREVDDPQRIDPTKPYRFFFEGFKSIQMMEIIKLEAISEFNNQM